MLPSKDLQYTINKQVFKEGFVFHGISRPVIRKVNGEYCIACFVTVGIVDTLEIIKVAECDAEVIAFV